jgi:hypothetical protein
MQVIDPVVYKIKGHYLIKSATSVLSTLQISSIRRLSLSQFLYGLLQLSNILPLTILFEDTDGLKVVLDG